MRVVLCNCSETEAETLARTLVEERLAACINIVPGIRSVYRWQGRVELDAEATLLMKTTDEALQALSGRVRELHSYELPEIIVLPVDAEASDPRYLAWVRESVEVAT